MVRRVHIITNCSKRERVDMDKVKKILEEKGLSIPRDDIENERIYRIVLKDFIMPAKEMYVGITSPLLKLANYGYKVYVISGRYGLIDANYEIIPYDTKISESKALGKARRDLMNVEVDGYVVLTRLYCEVLKDYIRGKGIAVLPNGCVLNGFENINYRSVFELKSIIKRIVSELKNG